MTDAVTCLGLQHPYLALRGQDDMSSLAIKPSPRAECSLRTPSSSVARLDHAASVASTTQSSLIHLHSTASSMHQRQSRHPATNTNFDVLFLQAQLGGIPGLSAIQENCHFVPTNSNNQIRQRFNSSFVAVQPTQSEMAINSINTTSALHALHTHPASCTKYLPTQNIRSDLLGSAQNKKPATKGRKKINAEKDSIEMANNALLAFFQEGQNRQLKTFCRDECLMDGYYCIRRWANKHTVLKTLMKQQTKKTGFSRSESRLAIVIIVEARNSPLSQSAKSLTLTPSTSEMKIIDQEFCVGLDHPIVAQSFQSNPCICKDMYDVSKGQCRSKKCIMTVPLIESHAVDQG